MQQKNQSQGKCSQCGTCCEKGGPAMHAEDRFLIDDGFIPVKSLFTIREGETIYDNIKQCLFPVQSDVIKIKSKGKSQTCIFFNAQNNHCQIYDHRPAECRLLKCWDTKEIEKYYDKTRLTRKELIGKIKGLWDIVKDHHQQCDIGLIKTFADNFNDQRSIDPELEIKTGYIIRYDLSMRDLVCEKGDMAPDMLPFLFGRTVLQLLESLGIKTIQNEGELVFKRH